MAYGQQKICKYAAMHSSMAQPSDARAPRLKQVAACPLVRRKELRPTLSIIRTAMELRVFARARACAAKRFAAAPLAAPLAACRVTIAVEIGCEMPL